MYGRPLLYLLALLAISLAEQRKLHRLVGGHLKIINPASDDSELMKIEASGSREKKQKSDQEEKKTLSQQVADGKYGLIQKELFSKPQKRPGVLSYDDNPEVPKDNKSNLGGLHKNEIWLAENHLLVIRGGIYPPYDEKHENSAGTIWPPIDNFNAPLHQVKIPKHPKVPPPFPVQFSEGGPLQILGTNSTRTLNDSAAPPGYALPPPDVFHQNTTTNIAPIYTYPANLTSWQAALPIPVDPSGEYPQGLPFPPSPLNGSLPPYFDSLPPGAVILPPPDNQTDLYDEDDPSIYYPPPYSFYYPLDNSSAVAAGPLVPGIILPPPPNFFAPLEDPATTTIKPQRQRILPTTEAHTQIHPTTTYAPITEQTRKPLRVYQVHDPYYTNEINPTVVPPKIVTILPVRRQNQTQRTNKPQTRRKKPEVTILRPVKTSTPPPIYTQNEISDKPFLSYGPPKATKKSAPTTTQVPLKYYTTISDIETNSVTQSPVKFRVIPETVKTTSKPVQYYYYEEELKPNSATTQRTPIKQSTYIDIPDEYYVPAKPTPVPPSKPQYIYINARPYNTQKPKFRLVQPPAKKDTFSIHITHLQNQINQYYTTPRPAYRPVQSPKPVYQFSFQAANYQPQRHGFRASQPDLNQEDQFRPLPKYSVQIQQAIEIIPTEQPPYQQSPVPVYYQETYKQHSERPRGYYTTSRPNYQYDTVTQHTRYHENINTPKPISQYSFEGTPSPVHQGFYTKPDEGYFDDNTKKYFTMFGKKLPSSTTPIPSVQHNTPRPNIVYNTYQQQQNSQYQEQKPISLEGDTFVNYVNPRPTINPDAELISINHPNNSPTTNYPNVVRYPARPTQYVQSQKHHLQGDENPQIIKAVPIEVPDEENQDGSFISYQLPGDDGAHFYFLTPQLAQRRDQGSGYYYTQPNNSQTRRSENKDKES